MRLRLPDPSSARRLAAFLRSLGVEATACAPTVLELEEDVDRTELAIYLRVWDVLHPDAVAQPENDGFAPPPARQDPPVSSEETHPAEEGFESGAERRIAEDAERYPAHEAPDDVREEIGLGEDGRRGSPAGAPAPEDEGADAEG